MNTLSYKTISANSNTVDKQWVMVDVAGMPLGRMASEVAKIIRGKNKPNYTPHVDCGDNVIVINSDKIELSGDKWKQKVYIRHTGYPGGQRKLTAEQLYNKSSTRLVENAVRGMLPKNKLGAAILKNCYIYAGTVHEQEAQKPTNLNLNDLK